MEHTTMKIDNVVPGIINSLTVNWVNTGRTLSSLSCYTNQFRPSSTPGSLEIIVSDSRCNYKKFRLRENDKFETYLLKKKENI